MGIEFIRSVIELKTVCEVNLKQKQTVIYQVFERKTFWLRWANTLPIR